MKRLLILILLLPITAWATYINSGTQTTEVWVGDKMESFSVSMGGKLELVLTTSGRCVFQWEGVEEATGYKLYCKGTQDYVLECEDTTGTLNLDPGEYTCYVTAVKGNLESRPSNRISVRVINVE